MDSVIALSIDANMHKYFMDILMCKEKSSLPIVRKLISESHLNVSKNFVKDLFCRWILLILREPPAPC